MIVDDLAAEAQGVCDQGWWQFLDEAAQGGVPCPAEVDAQCAELAYYRVGVDVLARQGAGADVSPGPNLQILQLDHFYWHYCVSRWSVI